MIGLSLARTYIMAQEGNLSHKIINISNSMCLKITHSTFQPRISPARDGDQRQDNGSWNLAYLNKFISNNDDFYSS